MGDNSLYQPTVTIPASRYREAITKRRLKAPAKTQMTLDTLVAVESDMFGLQAFTTSCSIIADMALIVVLIVLQKTANKIIINRKLKTLE